MEISHLWNLSNLHQPWYRHAWKAQSRHVFSSGWMG